MGPDRQGNPLQQASRLAGIVLHIHVHDIYDMTCHKDESSKHYIYSQFFLLLPPLAAFGLCLTFRHVIGDKADDFLPEVALPARPVPHADLQHKAWISNFCHSQHLLRSYSATSWVG